jgi:selenide,water dikinase
VDPLLVDVLFDPQTSGGLVLSVPEEDAGAVQSALQGFGDLAAVIGRVFAAEDKGPGLSLV